MIIVLLLALIPLWLAHPGPTAADLLRSIDHDTLAALAGLLILSRGLQESGILDAWGDRIAARAGTERKLAAVLVLFSAALAAVVTNDVALFILVPLTMGLQQGRSLPVGRLVVFEALAVNAGSTLSPMGNPQNLFLWQSSALGFWEFTGRMLPLGLALIGLVLLLIPLAFPQKSIAAQPTRIAPLRDPALAFGSGALYPLFLILVEMGGALPGAIGVFLLFLGTRRALLSRVDWPLLAVFLLMFVDLGLLAGLPSIQIFASEVDRLPGGVFTGGVLLSQLISNVPAALFLRGFTDEVGALAWGVSVGGFGLLIGSLANLIALRLAGIPGLWRDFHRWSLPALLGGIVLGMLLS
jgi:Na+/H+ antiporter NhaD/arsenite permease-like protein